MDFLQARVVLPDNFSTSNQVYLNQCWESQLAFSRMIAADTLRRSCPLRVTTIMPSVAETSNDIPRFLEILQEKLSLPFSWIAQIENESIQDGLLKCIAALSVLTVSRARIVQGIQDFSESIIRRAWTRSGPEASLSLALDQIEAYINPRASKTFVQRLSNTDLPTMKASIDYLVVGLIALKDAISLHLEKRQISERASTIILRNVSTISEGYLNSDYFLQTYFQLLRLMGHQLILVDEESLPEHYLSMIDDPQIVKDKQTLD